VNTPRTSTEPTPEPARPLLRVIHGGAPTDAELAALVAVVSARASSGDVEGPKPLRQPLSPWVASGLVKGTRTKA
jgi:Acyl-CoA carboxylase epsilon subunit